MMSPEERDRILREAKPDSWVAFSSDETALVGCGATYSEAVKDAEKHGEVDPVLVEVPESWQPRAFIFAHKLQIFSFPQSGGSRTN